MFEVMDKDTQQIYSVYSVDNANKAVYFLIYNESRFGWEFRHSSYFIPVENEYVEVCVDGRTIGTM